MEITCVRGSVGEEGGGPSGGVHSGFLVREKLVLRQARDARVFVPYYAMAPYLVAQSDLVFTTARHFAEQFTASLPVVSVPAPEGFPRMRFYQLWHERSQHQAAHRWLRGLLSTVGSHLAQSAPGATTGTPADGTIDG